MLGRLTFQTISDPSRIAEVKGLKGFVDNWSKNPFLFDGFISQDLITKQAIGWNPLYLVIKENGNIVGTAPLVIREQLGMRFAQLFPRTYAPDFIVDSRYRDAVMDSILCYLFERLNCQSISFCLSVESPNLQTIEHQCKVHGFSFSHNNQHMHYVIPVESSWDEFLNKRGRRRIIRQIERKLDEIGLWSVEYVENVSQHPEAREIMLDIEKKSWKAQHPEVIARTTEELLMSWKGSEKVPQSATDFKCSVWFLKMNNEAVAYTYIIKYKETAFVHKTSYDDRYKKLYVGKYINNIAIRDIFNEGLIRNIDFMSSFPYMSFWTPSSSTVVEVTMWKSGLVSLWKILRISTIVSKFSKILSTLPIRGTGILKSWSTLLE